eukprot:1135179_1
MATETETEIKDDDLPKIWKKEIPTLTEKHCFLIIHNWIRVSMLNVLLGDDVLVLLSRFANLKKHHINRHSLHHSLVNSSKFFNNRTILVHLDMVLPEWSIHYHMVPSQNSHVIRYHH